MKNYKKRIADAQLERRLKTKGAVLIQGPKWCGKTTTAEQIAKSILYMSDPEKKAQNLSLADISPSTLLSGDTPRLIDEWQIAPKLWDAIRFEIDHRDTPEGQFILTGSAVPANMDAVSHTGTGRFGWLTMRPMSLFESEESTGAVSLSDLFDGRTKLGGENPHTLQDIAYLCCRGGWPRSIFVDKEYALDEAFDYYEAVVESDVSKVDGVNRNPERVKKLMRSYARNIGTQASNETIKEDIIKNDSSTLNTDTVLSYVNALKKIFVVEESSSWNPNLRSKATIRTSETRYFVDPSIAVAALELGPDDLINDLNTFGFIFENLCLRDLRVYTEGLGGDVYHYRDSSGLECDAVVHLRNGSYGLIEIKLGGDRLIDEGVKNLTELSNKIDSDKMKKPAFTMILTANSQYAYQREDGIFVVPVGCLKD
ncbi:ATP-binding protein [Candidatus Saccharibacteria bacterium]|nr:ATP-binding protein [Candidatus Saccharibacteria bacterium]